MTGNPIKGTRSMPRHVHGPSLPVRGMMEYHATNRDIQCYAQSNRNGTYGGRVAITVQAGPYSDSVVREWPEGQNFRSPEEATAAAMQCAQRTFPPQRSTSLTPTTP